LAGAFAVTYARGVRLNLSRLPRSNDNVTVVSDLPKRVCMMCVVGMHFCVATENVPEELLSGLASVGAVRAHESSSLAGWLKMKVS
jgi:hypothetical protein